jgi:hypothetical protein
MLLMIALLGLSQAGTVQPARQAPPKVAPAPPEFWFGVIEIYPVDGVGPPKYGTIIVPVRPGLGIPDHTIGNDSDCDLGTDDFDHQEGHYGVVGPGIGEDWCNLDDGGFDPNWFTVAPPDRPPPPLYYTPWPISADPYATFDVVEDPEIKETVFTPWKYKITLMYLVGEPEIN